MISKSQTGSASVVLFALLFVSLLSGVVELTTTMLVMLPSTRTWVNNVIETGLFTSKLPMFQIIVFPFCLQFSGNPNTLSPLGKVSFTTTFSAVLGPLFTTVIVHSTMSVTFTLVAFTDFVITKSQIESATVVLFAILLDSLESGVVEFTTTVFIKVPLVKTLVTKIRKTGVFIRNSSIFQILVSLSKLPAVGVALMILKP